MYRIFVVEDSEGIVDGISGSLKSWGMETKAATDFAGVMEEFEEYKPHLVLLDISLPFMDGYHWCREIRKRSSVPVVIISSASDNMNIIMAMNMGADDFIAKPFDLNVLTAKIQALLRRAYSLANSVPIIEHNGAELNTGNSTLEYDGKRIELTKNEYRILFTLMKNKGKIVSREKLMEELWETDIFVDENTLTVNVGRLRKKLESAGLSDFISTKFGVGYIVEERK